MSKAGFVFALAVWLVLIAASQTGIGIAIAVPCMLVLGTVGALTGMTYTGSIVALVLFGAAVILSALIGLRRLAHGDQSGWNALSWTVSLAGFALVSFLSFQTLAKTWS